MSRKHFEEKWEVKAPEMVPALRLLDMFLWELLETTPLPGEPTKTLEARIYDAYATVQQKILGHKKQLKGAGR